MSQSHGKSQFTVYKSNKVETENALFRYSGFFPEP